MTFVFVLVIWIFSLCLHEFAHALVAYIGGDYTVKEKGYLSFNPLAYTDPVYSLVIPVAILLIGGLGLPGGCVYVERHLLKNREWDALVSLAGPVANAMLAVVMAIPFMLGLVDVESASPLWAAYAWAIALQICAVFFNLLPIPPLDGFGVVSAWMEPGARARAYQFGSQFGLFVLFGLFWYVDSFSKLFWGLVFTVTGGLGVPLELVGQGASDFRLF